MAKAEADLVHSLAPRYEVNPACRSALIEACRAACYIVSKPLRVLGIVEVRVVTAYRRMRPVSGRIEALVAGFNAAANYRQLMDLINYAREKGSFPREDSFFDDMRA